MTTVFEDSEISRYHCIIYTPTARTSGILVSMHQRLSDALNALDQDYLEFRQTVTLQPFGRTDLKRWELSSATTYIHRREIVLALPAESSDNYTSPAGRHVRPVERVPLPAFIQAQPFTVQGMLHLPPKVDLFQHLHYKQEEFLVVTEATVVYDDVEFSSDVVFVSRGHVQVVVNAAEAEMREHLEVDLPAGKLFDVEVNAAKAAQVLGHVPAFRSVDVTLLEQVCAPLCAEREIRRVLAEPRAALFNMQTAPDALYVVESGELRALRSEDGTSGNQERAPRAYGPGEFVGEVGLMGVTERTYGVIASVSTYVLELHPAAVQALVRRFPAAMATVMRALTQTA